MCTNNFNLKLKRGMKSLTFIDLYFIFYVHFYTGNVFETVLMATFEKNLDIIFIPAVPPGR